ncbi:MAG: hydantoinase B/oxoprolinase family protein [Deinococcota bacterium]
MTHINPIRIGIDVGGTFTDLVAYLPEQGKLVENKILTTPSEPTKAILQGVQELLRDAGLTSADLAEAVIIHGTTLITNALIERRGQDIGLITNTGATDILETGKGNRYDPYDRLLERPDPLVPRQSRKGLSARMVAGGKIHQAANDTEIRQTLQDLADDGVTAVAVCLMHSYADPSHERRVRDLAREMGLNLYITLSSDVAPELGEFERMTTAAANAYIQPIAEGYLATLQIALQDAGHGGPFYLMWSDGGLASVEATLHAPIRLLESGPAAGALAVGYLAKQHMAHEGTSTPDTSSASAKRVLAFDMGGTTAKLCLLKDGNPSRSASFEIGRVHRNKPGSGTTVKVPSIHMLEIGAGGGSIGWLNDLGLLNVGPHSAGADPGPACYGQGGTDPTVTDANLFLGYLSDDVTLAGGLALDRVRAKEALGHVASASGLNPEDVAIGIRRIVTETMAQAAQLHVTEQGDDPREYLMMAFGGAAPLHAFDMAQHLGITQVYLPKRAGVLSAFGFLTAQVGLERVQSFVSSLASVSEPDLQKVFDDLKAHAGAALASANVDAHNICWRYALDMRYRGQGYDIQVELEDIQQLDANQLEQAFIQTYTTRYGHEQEGAIEIRACRVVAQGPEPKLATTSETAEGISPSSQRHRQVWFSEGGWLETPVITLDDLQVGVTVNGPLLVEAPHTTFAVGQGGTLTLSEDDALLMSVPKLASSVQTDSQTSDLSPIDLEIIMARLRSIADEADQALLKTAFSSAVRDGKDYSLVVADPQGRCIAMPTTCMPLFVTCMPRTIALVTAMYDRSDFYDGDILMTNDPWLGAGHKSDVALIAPVFVNGELIAFIGTIVHVADIGGTMGDFRAWDIHEEGLMLPPCKLYEKGKLNTSVDAIIRANTRSPEMVIGDIQAMRTAIEVIRSRLLNLLEASPQLNLERIADDISNRASDAFLSRLKMINPGTYQAELVADGILEGDEEMQKPIHLALTATMQDDELLLDFAGSDAQRPRQAINVPISYTLADAIYAMQYMLAPAVPNIGPQFSPIRVSAPDGCILNAHAPVPVFARTRTGIHISTLVNAALAEAVPELVQAGCGHNIIFRLMGQREDGSYLQMTFMPKGGMGATGGRDGWHCTVYPTNCTMIATEVAETLFPIRVDRAMVQDSAGPGRERGGCGQVVTITSLSATPLTLGFRPNFIQNPPLGLADGLPGAPAKVEVMGKPQDEDPVTLQQGEWVRVFTAGGGGVGNPLERPRHKIMQDIANGVISPEHALEHYGVEVSQLADELV